MPKYIVEYIDSVDYEVDAANEEEAKDKINQLLMAREDWAELRACVSKTHDFKLSARLKEDD